jgi:hypothetical protein
VIETRSFLFGRFWTVSGFILESVLGFVFFCGIDEVLQIGARRPPGISWKIQEIATEAPRSAPKKHTPQYPKAPLKTGKLHPENPK